MVKGNRPSRKKPSFQKGTRLIKLSSLSRAEIAKINFADLWIMKPAAKMMPGRRARYCGCRNVCLA